MLINDLSVDQLVDKIIINSSKIRSKKRAIEATKTKVNQLENELNDLQNEALSKSNKIKDVVSTLKEQNVPNKIILEVIKVDYLDKKPTSPGIERKSHKLDSSSKEEILNFIEANSGVSSSEICSKFNNLDKQGIFYYVKTLTDQNKIKGKGFTKNRKYYPINFGD